MTRNMAESQSVCTESSLRTKSLILIFNDALKCFSPFIFAFAYMPRVFYFFLRNALAQSAAKFAMVANVNGRAELKTGILGLQWILCGWRWFV